MKLLSQFIPSDLSGHVSDFGCGYGYLSKFISDRCPNVRNLSAIDADAYALEICAANVPRARIIHTDLTQHQNLAQFDVIIMNPPFHDGKKNEPDLGLGFIQTASAHLKEGGNLYMVANAHLPYEKTLHNLFSKTEKLAEQKGFKIFKAKK